MKFDYKDKEFPSGLDEATKIITSKDLAKLLKEAVPSIDKLRATVVDIVDKLGGTDKPVSGDIDSILIIKKDLSDMINKLNNTVSALK